MIGRICKAQGAELVNDKHEKALASIFGSVRSCFPLVPNLLGSVFSSVKQRRGVRVLEDTGSQFWWFSVHCRL